ncbi:MAG: mechanosensitive ion channel family protein [Simkaniaceae bacterium]|nr:mechanosensitive ion channel family protein [Candidatus Sacchlamyda saccharinae]
MEPEKFISSQWWLIEIAIGLAIITILSFALKKIIKIVKHKVSTKEGYWKKKIHRIVHMPLQVAIWGFGFAYTADVIVTHFGWAGFAKYTGPLKGAFVVACLGWLVLRWLKDVFSHLSEKAHVYGVSTGTFFAVNKLCSILVVLITTMIILQIFGIGIAPLLAFGGIGVAGVAFAAKDIIANFFGGAMLHFTGIISIGDEVVIPSHSDFQGIVKDIGWYITRFEDYYRRPVFFPNATFTSSQVINESRRSHRRIKEIITIGYESQKDLENIVEELRTKVGAHPEVDNTQSFSISFFQYGDSGLQIYIYLLVYKMGYIKFLQTKQEILLLIEEVVAKFGAEFTYPTSNVNLTQVPPKPLV